MKHLELFAGIGGFRNAFNILGKDLNIPMDCVGYSEIDHYANKTYSSNYDISPNEIVLGDITVFTSNKENIENLPSFDILTGGFPCQSFSMMGKQKGFNDIRGNVFFNIIDILKIKKPKFVLLENVKNLLTHDKGNTIKVIQNEIKSIGYKHFYYNVFNTEKFGLAQKRNRIFIFATTEEVPNDFLFNEKEVLKNYLNIKTSLLKQRTTLDVLEKEVEDKYYLSETLKPTILSNGSKKFYSKSEINQLIARPLTATMTKMHRACQDNYFSYEFLNSEDPFEYIKRNFSKEEQEKHRIRKITPHEAFLLQGFTKEFVNKAILNGVSNHQLYKQAGNAVSVNTVYAVLHYIFIKNNFIKTLL
jgi:DNA (cytosine-5-)-methyltransferase